jgi:TolB-like protein
MPAPLLLENRAVFNALREVPAEPRLRSALDTQDLDEKLRLHRESAELFMDTGSFHKAAKRLEFICYKRPSDLDAHLRLAEAYLAIRQAERFLAPDRPRVVLLPLRNATRSPKDAWLARGWCHVVCDSARRHGSLYVSSAHSAWKAARLQGFRDDQFHEFGTPARLVASSWRVAARHVVTGSYVKLGNAVRFRLTLTDFLDTRSSSQIEVTGSLAEPRELITTLHDEIAFELSSLD